MENIYKIQILDNNTTFKGNAKQIINFILQQEIPNG